jgi:HAD superfamily hydrolase (TIGR01549 family)
MAQNRKIIEEQIKAVSFDAYGTLVQLDRPFERLAHELDHIGLQVPLDIATRVFIKEMVYYREHHLEGNNAENLLKLRLRCADLLFQMLDREGYPSEVTMAKRLEVLMGSIRFRLYEDALSVLDWCTANGLATGVVSGWDCSLVATLKEFCPRPFSQVIVSAIEGVDKSDHRLFLRAAKGFGVPPYQIIHIGDEIENDIQVAKQAGFKPVLVDRDRAHEDFRPYRIESLDEFPALFERHFSSQYTT